PTMQDAALTYLAGGAQLSADARELGNGGHIVLYGINGLDVEGLVNVEGGISGGNGGLIETSGKGSLLVANAPLLASRANGHGGTWLIDPTDVTISTAANSGESGGPTFTPTGDAATLN